MPNEFHNTMENSSAAFKEAAKLAVKGFKLRKENGLRPGIDDIPDTENTQ